MVNRVTLVGRLGKDPEAKKIGNDRTVCNFSIATNKTWVDREGKKQEKTHWHNIVVWGRVAELCDQYLSKGSRAYVEGELETRSYDDKTGAKRYVTEVIASKVIFLDNAAEKAPQDAAPDFDSNEEIPF